MCNEDAKGAEGLSPLDAGGSWTADRVASIGWERPKSRVPHGIDEVEAAVEAIAMRSDPVRQGGTKDKQSQNRLGEGLLRKPHGHGFPPSSVSRAWPAAMQRDKSADHTVALA